jgi:hypothetical protein
VPTSASGRCFVSGEYNKLIKVMTAPIVRITAGESHMSCFSIALMNGILCAHQTYTPNHAPINAPEDYPNPTPAALREVGKRSHK